MSVIAAIEWNYTEEQKQRISRGEPDIDRPYHRVSDNADVYLTPNYVVYGGRISLQVIPREEIYNVDVIEPSEVNYVDSIGEVDV